jgi:hypothetical protein
MADILNTSVFSQTDANNNTGFSPTFPENMAPSALNDNGRALQGAITRWSWWSNFTATSTGAANAYVLTYSVAPSALFDGQIYSFRASFANTGSCTLNINGLGAKTIKRVLSGVKTALAGAEIQPGQRVSVEYDLATTSWIWVNGQDVARTGTWTPSLKFGGSSVGITTSLSTGEYIAKDGKELTFSCRITVTAIPAPTASAVTITGLPVALAGSISWNVYSAFFNNMTGLGGGVGGYISGTTINLTTAGATGTTPLTDSKFTATTDIIISGTYRT